MRSISRRSAETSRSILRRIVASASRRVCSARNALTRFLRRAEVPGHRFLDVLDPVPAAVRRDGVETDGIDAEDRFGETVGLGPVGDEVVEEEFAARLVNAGPPCGRR